MRPKEEADDSADAILPPFRARTIVIVDDNRDAADSLALFLAARGHRVNVTYEGWKGLQLISELQPKIGIPDLHLPGVRP
jgi:DNA-binding response OmpR family regulator